jgi:ABC-2 type transport system permease protein
MTGWQMTWEVARWEFRRFLKPKQLLISLLTILASGAVGFGATRIIRGADARLVTLAVIGGETLGLGADTLVAGASENDATGRTIVLRPHPASDEAALRAAVTAREVDGLLLVRDAGRAVLVARRDPGWRPELERVLTAGVLQRRLAGAGLESGTLQTLLAPVGLTVERPAGQGAGRGERLLVVGVLALSTLGLMTGMGFLFAGITGEKQQRVTEQVVSAIPPQRWIDGKILGLAGVALVNTLVTAVAFASMFLFFALVVRRTPLALSFDRPQVIPLLVLLPLLGFLLWFTFLAAVAATIDDPHTSTKGSLLMLPLLPVGIAGTLFSRADSTVAQAFGVFPFTSPVVLPLRLLLADVALWEVPVSLLLLLATIWLLRRAAGKIFAVGMLMYGKEPSAREMWRWVREA